jgi:hypothetical protein
MGQVGRLQGNFDFGAIDLRQILNFSNPKRYGTRSLHIQCPFNYYGDEFKKQFFDLIRRDDEQQCGLTAQDIHGTLKGNWFFKDARADLGSDWNNYLAFAQDNQDPTTQAISIGGVFAEPQKWEFQPAKFGFVNRDFAEVIPDGNIYCYEGKNNKVIIVELASDTELKIEHQIGGCSTTLSFRNFTLYSR